MTDWPLMGSILLPNVGGWASTLSIGHQITKPDGNAWFETIKKPDWITPHRVFGHVMYTSIGYASYIAIKDCGGLTEKAVVPLSLYGGQLMLNWTWAPIFFGCHKIGLACIHMMALDIVATACTISFFSINKRTAFYMVPYLCCLGFATYYNFKIWQLNKEKKEDT